MDLPPVPQARIISLIDPVPVYPWWVIWRQRLSTRLVEELVAASPIPAYSYLPPMRGYLQATVLTRLGIG